MCAGGGVCEVAGEVSFSLLLLSVVELGLFVCGDWDWYGIRREVG